MICASCGNESVVNFGNSYRYLCRTCKKSEDQPAESEDSPTLQIEPDDIKSTTTNSAYRSNYGVAQAISKLLSFIGWFMVVVGTGIVLVGLNNLNQNSDQTSLVMTLLIPGVSMAISGLFLVAAAQVTQATVDNADHTREILKLLQKTNNKLH